MHAPVVRLLLTGAAALCVMAGLAFVRPSLTWGVIALACVMASVEFWLAGRD